MQNAKPAGYSFGFCFVLVLLVARDTQMISFRCGHRFVCWQRPDATKPFFARRHRHQEDSDQRTSYRYGKPCLRTPGTWRCRHRRNRPGSKVSTRRFSRRPFLVHYIVTPRIQIAAVNCYCINCFRVGRRVNGTREMSRASNFKSIY